MKYAQKKNISLFLKDISYIVNNFILIHNILDFYYIIILKISICLFSTNIISI